MVKYVVNSLRFQEAMVSYLELKEVRQLERAGYKVFNLYDNRYRITLR